MFCYREPPADPPCEKPVPEFQCPDCCVNCAWDGGQYFCKECIGWYDMPEPDYDFDDYELEGTYD